MPLKVLGYGSSYYPWKKRIRDAGGLVETLRHEANMQRAQYTSKEQYHNAAVFRMHEFETRATLLSDENRSLAQQMGSTGQKEHALTERLAEKAKEFDDLATMFETLRAFHNVGEARIRDELSAIKSENPLMSAQAEHARSEMTSLSKILRDCESVIALQKANIDELDRSASSGDLGCDPNYILNVESDHMMEALRRSMMESQSRAQADACVVALSVNMRRFNSDWERHFEEASKGWAEETARLLADLEVAQAAQRRLKDRVEKLEGVIRDWGYDDDDEWWAAEPSTQSAEASGGPRSGLDGSCTS